MKAKLISLIALLVIISHVYAQTTTPATPAAKPPATSIAPSSKAMQNTQVSAGGLLTQLASNIQPSAYSDSWAKMKDSWMKNVSALKPTDISGTAMAITNLANNLKPTSFTPDFAKMKDDWMNKTKSAKTMGDISSSLRSLSSGINASSFTADWAKNKSAWMQGLSTLATMK